MQDERAHRNDTAGGNGAGNRSGLSGLPQNLFVGEHSKFMRTGYHAQRPTHRGRTIEVNAKGKHLLQCRSGGVRFSTGEEGSLSAAESSAAENTLETIP